MHSSTNDISQLISEIQHFNELISKGYKKVFIPFGTELLPVSSIKKISKTLIAFYGSSANGPIEVIQSVSNINVLIMNVIDLPEPVHNPIGFITI